jgi:hypothetical protein
MRKKGENSVNLRAKAGTPPDESTDCSPFGGESQTSRYISQLAMTRSTHSEPAGCGH